MSNLPCAMSLYYTAWKNNRQEEKINKLIQTAKPGDLIFFDLDMNKTLPGKFGSQL